MKSPSANAKKRELISRVLIGVLGISAMVTLLWVHPYAATGLLIVLSLACLIEYDILLRSKGLRISRVIVYLIALHTALTVFLYAPRPETFPPVGCVEAYALMGAVLLALVPGLILILRLYLSKPKPTGSTGHSVLAILYVVLPWFLLALLSTHPELLLGFFFLLWASDTGAFFAGRALGKTPLFPRHSPKKTWEGFAGGLLLSMGVGATCAHFWPVVPLLVWLVLAVIVVVFGTLGDLCESMLKRQLGVKDSGHSLGSHGGFLDRFDGLLIAAPVFVLFLILWLTFS